MVTTKIQKNNMTNKSNNMTIEKKYLIKENKWTEWNETLADAIDDFHTFYALYPNILQANDYTFSQFDFLVNIIPDERHKVVRVDDVAGTTSLPDKTENILLSGFNYCKTADIDCAVDNQLADKEFRLVYDDESEWDEPEIPDDCPENECERVYQI